jgi:hypothetical protein
MGIITDEISAMAPDDARAYILQQFANLQLPEAFVLDSGSVSITNIAIDYPKLVVDLVTDLELPRDALPLEYLNPPYAVPDGTYTTVGLLDSKGDPLLDAEGNQLTTQQPNIVEDFGLALVWIVSDTLRTVRGC